jgi:hypothetical protein
VFKRGAERDTVSRADFTSRHLFQVDAQTRYNNSTQSLHSKSSLRFENNLQATALRNAGMPHDNVIQDQPNRRTDQTRHQQVASGTHFRNVMVLAKRLELRVEVVNTILMCLSCQLLHLIGKLRGIRKYNMQSGTGRIDIPVSAGPPGSVSLQLSFAHH